MLQGDQYLLNLLSLEISARRAGFKPEEIADLARVEREDLLRDLRDVLLGRAEIVPKKFLPPTWRVLTLNTALRTADDFRRALAAGGFKVGTLANDVLGRADLPIPEDVTGLELVVASSAELGFPEGAMYGDTCRRIVKLGYDLCPARLGPELRLQYPDQPLGEWLTTLAMEPITDSVGYLRAWYIECSGDGLWLKADYADPGSFWSAVDRWVFVRRPSTRA